MTMVTAVASLLALWLVTPARGGQGACAKDVAEHCAGVPPGNGRVLRCLDAHRGALGPACRAANDARLAARLRRHPCADDRARFCPHPPDGRGKVLDCLRAHADALSPSCRRAVAPRTGAPTR